MKFIKVEYNKDFEVLTGNRNSQSAIMILAPGTNEGGPGNKHENNDQWLYVLSGKGKAIVENKEIILDPYTLILIEKGETHEIKNIGDEELKTLNFYVPPAY